MSDLEKERIGQRAFVNQLCMNYIEDKRYYNAIEEWLNDKDNSHLVITGASGLGKSALIANWIKKNSTRRTMRGIGLHICWSRLWDWRYC